MDIIRCTNCNKVLKGRIVWMALDTKTGFYHLDHVPAPISQGAFAFGADCAMNVGHVYHEKMCESCGKPESKHVDEFGRHEPCFEQIADTVIFTEKELLCTTN